MTRKHVIVDGVRTTVEIDPSKYKKGTGTKRFVKSRQCAAVYTKGGRAGHRCNWYAREGSVYCKRHGVFEGHTITEEHKQALARGSEDYWARLRAIEQQFPGTMRRVLNIDASVETRRRMKELQQVMPAPKTDEPQILKAHKAIVKEIAHLPAVPDKPFEELEPHDQLTVLTGQSLVRVHEILSLPIKDKKGVVDLKAASLVKDTALRALAVRVKVDRNALAAKRIDKIGELLQRLKAPGDDAKVIDQ